MKKVPQRDSIPRVLRQSKNGIPGYENASGEEQMVLFSGLIQESGRTAVKKLWPKLDVFARSFVMEKLGCFAGPDSPQEFFRPRFESRRAVGPEVRRQIKMIKKSIEATEESSRRLEQLPIKIACYEQLIPASRSALAILENLKIVTARHFSGRADLDPEHRRSPGIRQAQIQLPGIVSDTDPPLLSPAFWNSMNSLRTRPFRIVKTR